ncbi:alpha/beta fold hydrolase [Roseobacter ponti]|uniref:Alpha/beta hydrolase n=1 Tax=Roseobacter ponti TaxID=1891787 RepID=A0A858STI4_9RHOB|nr:alpha/beta hydrolase [Roseobacter ponti]QJF52249.1 alpha/beta hydrolase [Roseobacter ponti]
MSLQAFSRTFGVGPLAALAIHCTLGHSGAWRGVGAALNSQLTLTACDLPGHGRSPDWDGRGDFHDFCTDLARSFLGTGVHLIGHSFGATVALRLAVENPDLVRSLTLIEPVWFVVLAQDNPAALAAHDTQAAPYSEALTAGDMTQAARLFNRAWGDGSSWADIPAAAQDYMIDRMHLVPAQSPMIFDDSPGLLRPGRLGRITVPVLMMRGAQSLDVTGHINAALAQRLPDAREVTIAQAGHMAPLTHPQAVADAIRSHIEMAEKGIDLV